MQETQASYKPFFSGKIFFFGVVLPILSLLLELSLHFMVDTLCTKWHILAFMIVPIANLITLLARPKQAGGLFLVGVINGIAIAISLAYCVLFNRMLAGGIVLIFAFGLGFLLISPLTAFIAAIFLGINQYSFARASGHRKSLLFGGLLSGITVGMFIMFLIESPVYYTKEMMKMTASEDTALRIKGIRSLRQYGNKEVMLTECSNAHRPKGHLLWEMALDIPKAHQIYYRVTGTIPSGHSGGLSYLMYHNFRESHISKLYLNNSQMEITAEPNTALAYAEWTLTFRNENTWDAEASTYIALPPDGVVSRLTLWVNGEEREAVITSRGNAQNAYNKVASSKKDPAVITGSGTDRVLLKCFPVPPHGEMKVRVGITAPLYLESASEGLFFLPSLNFHNFNIPKKFSPSVSFADKAADPPEIIEVSDRKAVRIRRSPEILTTWTPDSSDPKSIIRQSIREMNPPVRKENSLLRLIIVIDGSVGMKDHIAEIAEIFDKLPENIEIGVIFASDIPEDILPLQLGSRAIYQKINERMKKLAYEGGADNVAALERAAGMAETPTSAIFWIHGTQPQLWQKITPLYGKLTSEKSFHVQDRVFHNQPEHGKNLLIEALDMNFPEITADRLKDEFGSFGKEFRFEYVREKVSRSGNFSSETQASSHLERLWAYREILRLYESKDTDKALALAKQYRLVTPVSGAVVLETDQQYKENIREGNEAVEPSDIMKRHDYNVSHNPAPEPAALWLMAVAMLLFFVLKKSKRI